MSNEPRAPRLAVLIDADNASPRIASRLFEEIAKFGEASVRRIYGDFSNPRMQAWIAVLPAHAIKAQQNFPKTSGKNSADIALVIDAMDLLHTGRFDGFCLVSSDSDFTGLAERIREQGVVVYGFGEEKTPQSFRQACNRFIYSENLLPEETATVSSGQPGARPASHKKPPGDALVLLRRAVSDVEDDNGWVQLGQVGQQLAKIAPDFDPRTYGQAKLSDLVEKVGAFETRRTDAGHVQIRLRASGSKPKGKG
jgi:uncharacterized LabA/DUF88 family protein